MLHPIYFCNLTYPMPQIKKYYSYVLVAMTCAIGGFAASGLLKGNSKQEKETVTQTTAVPTEENNSFSLINKSLNSSYQNEGIRELEPFSNLIEDYIKKAKQKNPEILISYYFRDLDNGIWIGINEKEEFAPASLFKLPLMMAILKEAESNPAILSATYQYFTKDFAGLDKGDEGYEKKDGSFYSLDELLRQMIVYSDNEAALILLKYIGDDKLEAVEKFLSQSVPENGKANTNFIKVKNYASIFRVLYNCTFLNKEMSLKALNYLSQSQYKDGIRKGIPSEIRIAHKYGIRDIELNGSKIKGYQLHHFGIVYYPNKPFTIGIMTRGKNQQVSDEIISDLARITYTEVNRQMQQKSTTRIIP